ncbi:MAG TPA: pyridoxal-phosphate dependent enzyme [Steroidobacteraceae bacterium]|jgi:threonine dehydratase
MQASLLDTVRSTTNRIYETVRAISRETPLLTSPALDEVAGCQLFVKAESLQYTGSFKLRGAFYRLKQLQPGQRRNGVVAFSSGNFAQGLARAGQLLGVPVTIVMPPNVPQLKIRGTQRYGARVVVAEADGRPREVIAAEHAAHLAESEGLTLLHPFDDSDVVLGHSSLGTELLQQLEAIGEDQPLDTLLVPAGGGGLAAGIALALRAHGSTTRLIAVEPAGYDDLARSLAAGERHRNGPPSPTLCDALQANSPGAVPFSVLLRTLSGAWNVTDEEVRFAMRAAVESLKLVLEPSGASALAAALAGKPRGLNLGQRVGVICSGGNIAAEDFASLLSEARH